MLHPVQYSQAVAVNAGTMITPSVQIIPTTTGNFPQQMMSGTGKSTIIINQCRYPPANIYQPVVFEQSGEAANQQSFYIHKAITGSKKENTYTYRNRLRALQPKSNCVSTVPVHSASQVFNGSNIREMSSQPQIITAQASEAMLNQAELLAKTVCVKLDSQAANPLPPGSSWTPSGLQLYQNPINFYNQLPGIETAMCLPETTAAQPVPATSFAPATVTQPVPATSFSFAAVAPQEKKQFKLSKEKFLIEPSKNASAFPSNTQFSATDVDVNHASSTPAAHQMSAVICPTDPNPVQIVTEETISTGIEINPMSVETEIFSPQKSPTTVTPFLKGLHACVTPTSTVNVSVVSSAASPLIGALSTTSVMTISSVSCVDTITSSVPTVSCVDTITSSVPAVSSVIPVSYLTNKVLSNINSKPSLPEAHNEAVVISDQINTTETVITTEHLKPQQSIQQLSSEPVKDKQKAIVSPKVLTHAIDGFIIEESSEPFPVSQSPLLDSPCRALPPNILNSLEGNEDKPTVSNPEKKMRVLRPRGILELLNCAFCRKSGSHFIFVQKRCFCSKSCAKQFNEQTSKDLPTPTSAIQGYKGSGGRKRKRRRGKKRMRKKPIVEKENTNASPPEENPSTPENESKISCKTGEENFAPSFDSPHQIPIEVGKSNDEIGKSKPDVSQKLPSKWTVQDVFEFILNRPGCSGYADNFKSEEIDGQALLLLKDDHLRTTMCMKLGPALKLMSQIRSMEVELQS